MLFYLLSIVLIISALLVISSRNPIHSVLFLIVVFLVSSLLLFLLEIEFVSLMLILVYVGAIAVLFLFVVMMLDIKVTEHKRDSLILYLPMAIFLGLIFLSEIVLAIHTTFSSGESLSFLSYTDWVRYLDSLSDLEVLGQVLYTYYFLYFLLAGIILLVAMIGAIVLTLKTSKQVKHQVVFKQVLREKKNSVYLVS
jgi:NADH-quinone oxidoreductase subunit J